MGPPGSAPAAGPGSPRAAAAVGLKKPAADTEARLREAAAQFEAVFIQQMLASMRDTVPESGLVEGGHAEDLFASMLDGHLAESMAMHTRGGLADAIYRQLTRAMGE